TLEMAHVARARETGHTNGLMKAVVDAASGQILGAAILGEEGGETMTVLQMAMLGKVPYTAIKEMIIAHPLYAESLNNLFLSLDK
ncbi:MAG: FAD-containing oxidoreductase, partial [Bacteroidota bacterium]|nr:FAD-containing oxidoreductase [Bacteroidota bacterium]